MTKYLEGLLRYSRALDAAKANNQGQSSGARDIKVYCITENLISEMTSSEELDDIRSLQRIEASLELTKNAFKSLVFDIESGVEVIHQRIIEASLRTTAKQRHLPDELWDAIFEGLIQVGVYGGRPKLDLSDLRSGWLIPLRMSHVCAQFRRVILGNPLFWSFISNHQHPELVAEILTRSRNGPLNVSIAVDDHFPYFAQRYDEFILHSAWFTKEIAEHSNRCASLAFSSLENDLVNASAQPILNQLSTSMQFPNVRQLHVYSRDIRDISQGQFTERFDFYKDWDMPNLCELKICNFVPPLESIHRLRGIKSFQFTFFHSEGKELCLDTFLHFLGALPQLEELCLDTTFAKLYATLSFQVPITLPNLKRLSVLFSSAHDGYWDIHSIRTLNRLLCTPNIVHLTYQLPITKDIHPMAFVQTLLPSSNDYQKLETFDLSFISNLKKSHPLVEIPERLKNLQHLSIHGYTTRSQYDADFRDSNLETLRLENCEDVDANIVAKMMGASQSMKKVEILNCPKIGSGAVNKMERSVANARGIEIVWSGSD